MASQVTSHRQWKCIGKQQWETLWLSKEIASIVVRLSEPIPMDPWSQLRGDLLKQVRLDYVYGWEESCPAAAGCPYFEISIYLMLCFHYIIFFGICVMMDDQLFECSCIEFQDLCGGRMNLIQYGIQFLFSLPYFYSSSS